MPGYAFTALHTLQHDMPTKLKDAPHAWNQPTYGAHIQYAPKPETTLLLTTPQITCIQHIIVMMLFYSITVDNKKPFHFATLLKNLVILSHPRPCR
jgi:hypothetical protein